MPGSQQNEVTLLEQYDTDMGVLVEQLRNADPQASKRVQQQIDQKTQIYWKQIQLVELQFPDSVEGKVHEAAFYTYQAMVKVFSAGMARRVASKSSNTATIIAAGLIAGQQEKNNAAQALALLDQALGVFDYPDAHLTKAEIYDALKQPANALSELNYIIANFQDDDAYLAARQLKDAIENPPKKGPCFVATACYGDFDHPDVLTLRRWRDDTLLQSHLGRLFVCFYYRFSPRVATRIASLPRLADVIRRYILAPLVAKLARK